MIRRVAAHAHVRRLLPAAVPRRAFWSSWGSTSSSTNSKAKEAAPAETADAVIIGAGIIGASIALQLARKGVKAVVLEKGSFAGSGTTSFSSGICRTCYSDLDSVKMALEGMYYYKDWANVIGVEDPLGLASLREVPVVALQCPGSRDFVKTTLAHHVALGIPYEVWTRKQLANMGWDTRAFGPARTIDDPNFGAVNPDPAYTIDGAIVLPASGFVSDPQLAVHNLKVAGAHNGVSYKFDALVSRITQENGRVTGVELADGRKISTGIVVNAAGPYSSRVNKLALTEEGQNDSKITLRALRQEVAYVPAPPAINTDAIIFDLDTGFYLRPDVKGKILVGSTEPKCDVLQWVDDPDHFDQQLGHDWTQHVYRASLRLPGLVFPHREQQGIVSLYDVSSDWAPIYDKSALHGYFMACGTSGNQFKNGGVAGKLMAELILAVQNGLDHDSTPYQFATTYTNVGGTINTGAFSRLRTPNATTASVLG